MIPFLQELIRGATRRIGTPVSPAALSPSLAPDSMMLAGGDLAAAEWGGESDVSVDPPPSPPAASPAPARRPDPAPVRPIVVPALTARDVGGPTGHAHAADEMLMSGDPSPRGEADLEGPPQNSMPAFLNRGEAPSPEPGRGARPRTSSRAASVVAATAQAEAVAGDTGRPQPTRDESEPAPQLVPANARQIEWEVIPRPGAASSSPAPTPETAPEWITPRKPATSLPLATETGKTRSLSPTGTPAAPMAPPLRGPTSEQVTRREGRTDLVIEQLDVRVVNAVAPPVQPSPPRTSGLAKRNAGAWETASRHYLGRL